MLSIEGLCARLGDFALDGVDIEVSPGTPMALVGPSGAGKSSLLRCVAGLVRPAAGSIRCDGEEWFADGRALLPESRRCGFVFQDYALFPHLPVWRNVSYGLRGSPAERRARALELLGQFGIGAHADARPRTLSGGERQRVALARALAAEPTALLLDEPLSALDARTRAHATRELAETIEAAHVPTIVVTHDFEEAAVLARFIAVIDEGRVVQTGTPGELAARPASSLVADLVGSVVLRGQAKPTPEGTVVTLQPGAAELSSTDIGVEGPCAVSVHPWEVTLERKGESYGSSARNRLPARIMSTTDLGGRVRVGLDAGQPLAAEVTPASVRELGLEPGAEVVAVWKASATRVVEL